MDHVRTSVAAAINTYHELNASIVDDLPDEPSALEFMRFVSKNRPFVVRRTAADWRALKRWDAEYLKETLGNETVQVAITPHGNADAVVQDEHGDLLFVEPYEAGEPFNDFLDYVQDDSAASPESRAGGNVRYAQTQNDNLRNEYDRLFTDVPKDIPFARIALEQEADAINLWIGNERSTTALHKDNYENVYVQVRGQKHFTLLPPVEMPCVNEKPLPKARYALARGGQIDTSGSQALRIEKSEDGDTVPVATWDPDEPHLRPTPYSHLAMPLKVTLDEGDMLYLPAMWYHKVQQTAGDEGFACAVNYWYDMDFAGGFWTANSFLRDVSLATADRR